eukprot:scaffold1294_cov135-Skeletonema_menzelii.AAC.3
MCGVRKCCITSNHSGKVKEVLRLLGYTLFNTHRHMFHIRRLSINLGLVDHSHNGNDCDGCAGGILVFEERA